jgi:hypothetical protein
MTDAELALAFKRSKGLRRVLDRVDAATYAIAAQRPVLLERQDNGDETWLGMTVIEGNLKIDADKGRAVVREMLDEAAVDEVSKYTVTQKLLEEACKKRVPRGPGAAKLRAVLDEMKKRGAATKPTKHGVDIYPVKRAQLAKAG